MTAQQLDRYLKSKGSPLAGHGRAFIAAGRRFRVDPRLLVAITGAESSFGKNIYGSHNPFGWGPGIDFRSWGDAINTVARGLRQNYLGEGLRTVPEIGAKYAPSGAANDPHNLNSAWVKNVQAFLSELGGGGTVGPGGGGGGAPMPSLKAPSFEGFADMAMANLQGITAGQKFDPIGSLTQLASLVQANESMGVVDPMTGAPVGLPGGGGARMSGAGVLGGVKWKDLGGPAAHAASGVHIWQNDNAVDLGAPVGTPIYAARGGRLVGGFGESSDGSGKIFGKRLTIESKSGNQFFYTHMGRYAKGIRPGATVRRGQLIGFVGPMPGGPSHLHFAVMRGDPYRFLRSRRRRHH